MATFSTWYNQQYASWNRIRNIRQQPYIARVDTNTSRASQQMAQNAAVAIDMGTPAAAAAAAAPGATSTSKANDTLFGPNIGVLGGGPEWTESAEKSSDVLTPEILKSWIAKSKETHYSTTTLQALVNLKRPTLRLSPLEGEASEDPDQVDAQHHHALEFEYDCDAPKCAIRVHVLLSPKHHMAGKPQASGTSSFLVFETTTEGGFGKLLKFEDGAMLELGSFDHHRTSSPTPDAARSSSPSDLEKQTPTGTQTAEPAQRKKRFTNFHFRKRNQDRNVAGPALAVVDADAQVVVGDGGAKDAEEEDVGVRVTIRLSALDEEGKELPSPNEQVTYLHIVRFGVAPVAVDGVEEEDKRPWVVKVVKREATIGLHTFHLHEIYGLSANSTTSSQPTAAPPTAQLDTHTYPPTVPPATRDEESSSECLLCLSAPREVVLLPCRHLVACRECALNMIEFGAGGTIVHTESETGAEAPAPEGAAGESNAEATAGAGPDNANPSSQTSSIPTVQASPRRKRKAKGWFCPVCRQPYTSLLRITTIPPEKDEHRDSASLDEHLPVPPAVVATIPAPPPSAAQPERGRFGFLRAFGRQPSVPQVDVERGQAPAANAA